MTTTIPFSQSETFTLNPGLVLAVTLAASSSATVIQLANQPGGEPGSPIALTASAQYGPFLIATRWSIACTGGAVSFAAEGQEISAQAREILESTTAAQQRTLLGLDNIATKLSKLDATTAPTVDDDVTLGYEVGSTWIDLTADLVYTCTDATDGAAVWVVAVGDVTGPAGATAGSLPVFSGTTGKVIEQATTLGCLTTTLIATLTTTQMTAFTTTQLGGLSTTQVGAFAVNIPLEVLTTTQIAAMTTTQLGTLSHASLGDLTTGNPHTQYGLVNAALSTTQIAGLTATVVQSMTTTAIESLTTTQLASISHASLGGLSAGNPHPQYVLADGALSTTNIATLTTTALATLTATQHAALTTTWMGGLTATQVGAITTTAFTGVTTTQVATLTTTQVAGLTSAHVGAMGGAKLAGDGQELSATKFKDSRETLVDQGSFGGTQDVTLDYSAGNRHKITITAGTATIKVTNWPATGIGGELHVILVNGGLGTIVWAVESGSNPPVWAGGSAPTPPAAKTMRVVLFTEDGGTTVHAASVTGDF